ncbi:MAG: ribonuclease H-like domain-containing protein [Candidatus Brocadiia bacterium]
MSADLRKKLDELAGEMEEPGEDKDELRRTVKDLREKSAEKRQSRPAIRYHRDMPRTYSSGRAEAPPGGEPVKLEDAVEGGFTRTSEAGTVFVIENPLCEIEDQAGKIQSAFRSTMQNPESGARQRIEHRTSAGELGPEDVVFMDIETTGLSSSPLFLIGVMCWDGGELLVRQFLARDYSEEKAAIEQLAASLEERGLLVTFNGKSFDMPYVKTRAAATLAEMPPEPAHFDLLHVSRRVWKGSLPDCKLQTLETHICRRPRYGDIPGERIPEAYHAFVRSGDARQIISILHHNVLDIVTMADLMVRLPACD